MTALRWLRPNCRSWVRQLLPAAIVACTSCRRPAFGASAASRYASPRQDSLPDEVSPCLGRRRRAGESGISQPGDPTDQLVDGGVNGEPVQGNHGRGSRTPLEIAERDLRAMFLRRQEVRADLLDVELVGAYEAGASGHGECDAASHRLDRAVRGDDARGDVEIRKPAPDGNAIEK